MKVLFILLSVMFCLLVMRNIKRTNRLGQAETDRFWQREAKADFTRKQDISQLDYINIPLEQLPFGVDSSSEVQRTESSIRQLKDTKILNLNNYTNTDLKLMYGVANLTELSECDNRFTILVRTLYQWACRLQEHGHIREAIQVAEYSIEIGSDISGCYYMLADYYQTIGDNESLDRLRASAETLTGLNAKPIKEYLNKSSI